MPRAVGVVVVGTGAVASEWPHNQRSEGDKVLLHAFDCGCMSYSDFGFVATLGSRTHFSIADYGHFIGIMQRCYQGNFSDLPSRDLHVLMEAFLDQFVAYCTAHFGVQTQAQTPVPTDENAGADVATPEADRLLRMMDVIMNGGMEQG